MRGLDRLGRVPAEVRWLTALFALVLVVWTQLTPAGRAPDESVHVDLIEHVASGAAYPEHDGRTLAQAPAGAWFHHILNPLTPEGAASGSNVSRTALGGDEPTAYANQMPQHPPLYYLGMGTVLRTAEAIGIVHDDAPYTRQWGLLRLANVALMAPLPVLAWAAARRLGARRDVTVAAAALPLCVPQLAYIGSSVNNDNLLVLFGGVLAVQLAGVTAGDARRSTALRIGLVAGLGLLTKAFALAFLPWILAAYLAQLAQRRSWSRADIRSALGRVLLAAGVVVVVGGWWPLRNLMRYDTPFPSVLDQYYETAPAGFQPDFAWYGPFVTRHLTQRFWGSFGPYEVVLPPAVVLAATFLLAGALGATFIRLRGGAPQLHLRRVSMAAYGSVALFCLVLVVYRSMSLYLSSGRATAIQGRYLFGAIIVLCVLAAVGTVELLGRRAALALLCVAVAMQGVALHVTLVTWWAEPDASIRRSLWAMVRWSPWPDAAVVFLLLATVATTIGCAVVLRPARSASGVAGEDQPQSVEGKPRLDVLDG